MERLDYFIKRLLLIFPTFIGITGLCFLIIQFVPGGPVEQAIMQMKGFGGGEISIGDGTAQSISEKQRKEIEAYYGFDQPLVQRYWKWLVVDRIGMAMPSYRFPNKTAWQLIKERFPVSLTFGITGFVLSYLVCIPLGIAKALRHGGQYVRGGLGIDISRALPAEVHADRIRSGRRHNRRVLSRSHSTYLDAPGSHGRQNPEIFPVVINNGQYFALPDAVARAFNVFKIYISRKMNQQVVNSNSCFTVG